MNSVDPEDLRADERLWTVLGRSRTVEASPWFARRVVRAVRDERSPSVAWWRRWAPATACAAVALLALLAIPHEPSAGDGANVSTLQRDFEAIADLDLLLAKTESSLWLNVSR